MTILTRDFCPISLHDQSWTEHKLGQVFCGLPAPAEMKTSLSEGRQLGWDRAGNHNSQCLCPTFIIIQETPTLGPSDAKGGA